MPEDPQPPAPSPMDREPVITVAAATAVMSLFLGALGAWVIYKMHLPPQELPLVITLWGAGVKVVDFVATVVFTRSRVFSPATAWHNAAKAYADGKRAGRAHR